MDKQSLILIRSFLLKTFVVGLVFTLLLFFGTVKFWEPWSTMVYSRFQVTPKELGAMVVKSFLCLRAFLIFGLLVPAISLHWVIKTKK